MALKHTPPLKEKLKSIPAVVGIRLDEEAGYKVEKKSDDIEIRMYEPMTLASVAVGATDHYEFQKVAFPVLADYIFGNEIAMTIPVIQTKEDDVWQMSFVLPENMNSSSAPVPTDASVNLIDCPAKRFAVYSYTGNQNLDSMQESEAILRNKISQDKQYRITGDAIWAGYDQPFAVPVLKRNEVWLPVEPAI